MPNYQVITKTTYANKRWLRYSSYAHAADAALMPLAHTELPKALLSLPIAFSPEGDSYITVAVMNIAQGKNLFVEQTGKWIGQYTPAAFRSYPFILGDTPGGQTVLCVDEDSGLVNDGPEGEAFFDEEGNPSKAIQDVLGFLNTVQAARKVTATACAVLAKHELIQPWPINVETVDGVKSVDGLYRIDEAKLNQLSPDALVEVRDAGGLLIAYCQLLSMQHLPILGELTKTHAQVAEAAAKQAATKELDLEFLNKNSTISFAGF